MAVTSIKKAKVSMYKMVSLPTISGSKDAGVKATQSSYRAFTTGLNKIGGTLNSTIVVNTQIRDALIQNLKLKDAAFEEDKKRFQKEKEDKNKIQKKTGGGFLGGVAEVAAKMTGGFLSGLASLAGTLMKFIITQSVLKWIANPANMKKLVSIVEAIIKVVTFLSKFLSENIIRMLDGLATMLDGNKNIFQKLGGFVTFITGFGSILGAALILKKPGLVLKGVGWVLTTLYKSLFKSKLTLTKQIATGGGGGGFGAFSKDQSAKAAASKGGGRFGAIAKGLGAAALIATPLIVGASMAGDSDESSTPAAPDASGASTPAPAAAAPAQKSSGTPPAAAPGGDKKNTTSSQLPGGIPQLAKGGVATRPTEALIGEAGPELRMPLDNAKRMRDSGIKPLSSLMGGNKPVDNKQSKKLSDLFIAPFRGIGAGILANVSQLVSGMGPAGAVLTPILGNIIAPIANSFGVPPSLVKSLTSKTPQKDFKSTNTGKKKGDLSKLFGRGSVVKEDSKKYKRVGDSSVLGLLTNMLAAVQVIGNKVGSSSKDKPAAPAAPGASGAPTDTPTAGAQGGGSSGGATNTAQESIKKAGGMREDGTLQGIKGTTIDKGRGGKEHSPGAGLMPVDGGNKKYWYNNSGDVFKWEKPGDPLTDITSAADKQAFDIKTLGGSLVRDLKDGKVKIIKAQGLFGMAGGDQTPVGYYNYQANGILKESAKPGPKGTGPKDKWEQPKDGRYGPTIAPKSESPKKANGGWISGPQSGYPVSLDGGGSTSFIGHGTEWVGYKKAAQGGAFVVPFDTPATKNNPGLTSSRMTQAKSGGYALPTRAMGGKVDTKKKGSGDEGLKTKTTGGAVITSKYGPRGGRLHAGTDLAGVPSGTPIKSLTGGKVLYASTYGGYGNTVDLQVSPGKIFRFGHLDGFGVKAGQVISAGDIIGTLGNTGIGTGPHLHFEHRKKLDFGAGTSMDPETTGALSEIAIGGKPISGIKPGKDGEPPSGGDETTPTEKAEAEADPFKALSEAVGKLRENLGYAPTPSVEQATLDTAKAKDQNVKAAKEKAAKATGAALSNLKSKSTPSPTPATSSSAVILPGGRVSVPVELAWASTTSLYQPKTQVFT